jgi:hypothetical protein
MGSGAALFFWRYAIAFRDLGYRSALTWSPAVKPKSETSTEKPLHIRKRQKEIFRSDQGKTSVFVKWKSFRFCSVDGGETSDLALPPITISGNEFSTIVDGDLPPGSGLSKMPQDRFS